MQYGGAHIGKLPQFAVRDLGDGTGVGDDAGIRHQKPRNIRPVFIQIGTHSTGYDSAGNIAAAAGKCLDAATRHHAVKAGDHAALMASQKGGKTQLCPVFIKIAVGVKQDAAGWVDKGDVQEVCQD